MKRALMVAFAGLVLAVSGCSQPYGMGSGMMRGDGPGYWHGGYGMNPGMMGGDYGAGGHGMGPGMMRGDGSGPGYRHGGYGMGPGMMWGDGALDLTDEQRAKLAGIQSEFSRKQWALMEKMHEQGWHSGGFARDGKFDEQAARKAHDTMAELRKQMFENSLEAHKQIDSLLTPQQREQMQMHRGWGRR